MRRPWLILVAIALLLAGCATMIDINHRILVLALGLDADESGQGVQVSIHYLSTAAGQAEGGGPGQKAPVTHVATGPSVISAVQRIGRRVPGEVYLGSVELIVIGERLARRGIGPALDYLMRQPHVPTNAMVVMAPGGAAALLQAEAAGALSPAVQLVDAMQEAGKLHGDVTRVRLWQLDARVHEPHRPILLPVASVGEEGPQLDSVALVTNGTRLRLLSLPEAMLIHAVVRCVTCVGVFPGEGDAWQLSVLFNDLRVRADMDRHEGPVQVRLHANGFLLEGPDHAIAGGNPSLERHVETVLTERLGSLLESLYRDSFDALDLGETVRRRSADGRLPADWKERLPKLKFHVESQIKLLHGLRGM